MGQILYSLTVLQDALLRMGRTAQTRVELEMAAIKLCSPELDRSLDAILARLDRLEAQVRSGAVVPPAGEEKAPALRAAGRADEGSKNPSSEASNAPSRRFSAGQAQEAGGALYPLAAGAGGAAAHQHRAARGACQHRGILRRGDRADRLPGPRCFWR